MTPVPDQEELPEVVYAEHPQRSCRQPVTEDGLIDHWCGLQDMHPGPCCPRTLRPAIKRRQGWEQANPGWRELMKTDDPFADVAKAKGAV